MDIWHLTCVSYQSSSSASWLIHPNLDWIGWQKNVISNRPRDIAKIYTMLANNMKMSYAYNCIYNCIYIINIHHLIPDHCIRFYCFPIFSLLGFVASRGSGEVPSTMCLSWDLDDFLVKLGKIWLSFSLGTWILYFLNYAWVFFICLYNVILYYITLYYILYYIMLYYICIILYYILYYIIWFYIILSIILYDFILYYPLLYYVTLYYIILC